jgi:transposase
MARPNSMDLRERAMGRVQVGGSVRVVAHALSLSPSSVVKWSRGFRAIGSASWRSRAASFTSSYPASRPNSYPASRPNTACRNIPTRA